MIPEIFEEMAFARKLDEMDDCDGFKSDYSMPVIIIFVYFRVQSLHIPKIPTSSTLVFACI